MTASSIGASLASILQQTSLLTPKSRSSQNSQTVSFSTSDASDEETIKRESGYLPNADGTSPLTAPDSRKEGERQDLTPATQQATDSAELVGYPSYNSFGRYKSPRASAGTSLNVSA